MYMNTKASIKLPGGQTDVFKTNIGIRQGDCLSPILFCLYIEEMKSKVMVFKSCGRKTKINIDLNGHELESVTSYKYLGITFHSSGSFTQGIEELSQKGKRAWFSLRSSIQIENLNNPKLYLK